MKSFASAMADDRRLYEQTGCSLRPHANTKSLALDALKMPHCNERDSNEIYMVNRLAEKRWPAESIDLLGYL